MKGYFEAFFEQPPPFKLTLVDTCTEETVWSATLRDGTAASPFVGAPTAGTVVTLFASLSGDCVDNAGTRQRKRPAREFIDVLKKIGISVSSDSHLSLCSPAGEQQTLGGRTGSQKTSMVGRDG